MASVLFVTWDGGGNVPPALGLAEELRRRGHAVRFLGHAQQQPGFEAAGFPFRPYSRARPWSSKAPLDGLAGALAIFRMFADRGPGLDLLDEVARAPVDVAVVDCMSLGCLAAAQQAGLRRVVLAHTFFAFLAGPYARGPVGGWARLHGLRPPALWASADRVLVVTDRELDPVRDRALPACARHVGVVQPVPEPRRGDDRGPRVLVSLSSTYFEGQQRALQHVVDALAVVPAHAVVTTGHAVDPASLRVPEGMEVHRFVPHERLMPDVDLVVGHGGHATTMRALAHDLPLVVLPMHPALDQRMVGRSLERAGAARVLPKTAEPARIGRAVEELLADGPHRQAAARLGARLRSQDGAARAADEVEAVLA